LKPVLQRLKPGVILEAQRRKLSLQLRIEAWLSGVIQVLRVAGNTL
jgi:hypothetical protein